MPPSPPTDPLPRAQGSSEPPDSPTPTTDLAPTTAGPSAKARPDLATAEEPEMRLAALVPLGVPIHGFRLPRFDDTGRLVSFIEVDELRRVSSDRFALREVRVRLYNAEGEEMRRIETPQARLYLKHGLLAGDHQVTISRTNRPEPESVGRGFVYDLDTQVWSLLSEVTTRIPVSPATPGSATP